MAKKKFNMKPQERGSISELIKRRRLQMMVHACVYYEFDTNIVSDHQYDSWGRELANLLHEHPDAYSDQYDEYFENWTGDTGYQLPTRDPWVMGIAQQLIEYDPESYVPPEISVTAKQRTLF